MSTQNYQDRIEVNQAESYQNMQWGTSNHPSRPASHSNSNHQQRVRYNTDHYQHTPEEPFVVNVDYSQVAAVETGFKKLKSNQIEILKELKREYQVLRNTELESGMIVPHRPPTQSVESVDDSSSKSISDVQSSTYSRAEKTRKKSHNKQLQVAAIERKQMEMMLNNSMKKIEQLLATEIELKRTVAELRNKLESRDQNEEDHEYALKKYRQEVDILTRSLEDSRRQCDSVRSKSKETVHSLGSLQGQIAVNHIQLKKKDERIRILEQEVYLEKNKLCTVELDMKKYKLEAEMLQRNHKEELSLFQRRLASIESEHLSEKQDEIRKLKHDIELKDERYKMVLEHLNKEKQEKDEISRRKQVTKDNSKDKEYIKQLEDLVEVLKSEKEKKTSASEEVLSSILEKMSTINSQSNHDLVNQIHQLKKQLELVHASPSPPNNIDEENLQQKIRELERSIEEENLEKMYFFEDLARLKDQLIEQKKVKESAVKEANGLRHTLQKVQEEATKYSYQLQALRHLKEQNFSENQTKTRDVMFKSQLLQNKEIEIAEVREELNQIIDEHRNQIKQYEEEVKVLKRQLAEEEVKNYKIKEELELKLSLAKTEYEAQLTRNQENLDKVKKGNAEEYNTYFSHKISLEDKILEKDRQISKLQAQVTEYTKEKDTFYENYKHQQDRKVQSIQEEHTNSVNHLASKLESLAEINTQHMKLMQRNTWLEQETAEMKRIIQTNKLLSEGVNHLWCVKEAEYSNLNEILKAMQ